MEDELHKRIIGQDQAVKAVSQAIRRTRAGLKDPKRPSGSFIFAGPSGVGKTELTKALAEFLFGDEDALIQVDMGEFHDRYTASRLFGAPPGYVGYEEGGQLTEKVRRKPFSVVLFDEIEKAHQDIYNTLLQVLEDGRLTDGQGRTVDFKNTVIVFTSNLGTQDISKAVGMGFAQGNDAESNYDRMKQKVNDELKRHFRPEFLNRIDDVVVFHQLTTDEINQMVDLMLKRVEGALKNKDMTHRGHRGGEDAARRARVRPGARRAAAAPDHPAGDRGQALGEDPVRRDPARPDHPGRRRRRGQGRGVHLPRRAEAVRRCPRSSRSVWPPTPARTRPDLTPDSSRRPRHPLRWRAGVACRRLPYRPGQPGDRWTCRARHMTAESDISEVGPMVGRSARGRASAYGPVQLLASPSVSSEARQRCAWAGSAPADSKSISATGPRLSRSAAMIRPRT